MSEATSSSAFSARGVLILVLVGVVAFAGLAVLAAYAPELRSGQDGRAHALSRSAVGYAGAALMMRQLGVPVTVSRLQPARPSEALVVLTPEPGLKPEDLKAYPKGTLTLIVLPKWAASPDPLRPGFVRKVGLLDIGTNIQVLLSNYAPKTQLSYRQGITRPLLRGTGDLTYQFPALRTGKVDRLAAISGEGWEPLILDDQGRAVLVQSRKSRSIWVLADPDLLNNQGLADLATARAGVEILQIGRNGDQPVIFDVTLNGFERGRGLGRMMLEPPWLSATLIAVAAVLLMGVQALARFGQPLRRGRAFALGVRTLVDNSADLIRMARKEHEMAPAYGALTRALAARDAGQTDEAWLDDLARRRGLACPVDLATKAGAAKTREDLLEVARTYYQWRGDLTRERR